MAAQCGVAVIEQAFDSVEEPHEIRILSNIPTITDDSKRILSEEGETIGGSGDSGSSVKSCQKELTPRRIRKSKSGDNLRIQSNSVRKDVFCGQISGILMVEKLKDGSSKCIRHEDDLRGEAKVSKMEAIN